jgi:hypothetical protein
MINPRDFIVTILILQEYLKLNEMNQMLKLVRSGFRSTRLYWVERTTTRRLIYYKPFLFFSIDCINFKFLFSNGVKKLSIFLYCP